MKTIGLEQTTLDACVREAQGQRILVTRNGVPVALLVGVEGLDEEQVQLGSTDEFWTLIADRRRQQALGRAELERKIQRSDCTLKVVEPADAAEREGQGS